MIAEVRNQITGNARRRFRVGAEIRATNPVLECSRWGGRKEHRRGENMSNPRNVGTGSALCWNDESGFPLDWNGPVNRPFDPFPDEAKGRPIIELLEAVVHRYPERIALAHPDASITYAEIWRALAGWAERIAEATAPGDLVGIVAPVSTAFPIAMLACLAAGRPFVALDCDYPPEWIARILDDSRPNHRKLSP